MTPGGRALLLVGSPRTEASTSEVLGAHVTGRLADHGLTRETINLGKAVETDEGIAHLLAAVDGATVAVLSAPMYVDALPAPATRALELIAAHRGDVPASDDAPLFAAIVNLGFPEASQAETALAICRRFSDEARLRWAGGLGLGGGPAIDGRPLGRRERMTRNVRAALDLAAEALAVGDPVPEEAVRLMARPLVGPALYRFMVNRGYRRRARKTRDGRPLDARPYLP